MYYIERATCGILKATGWPCSEENLFTLYGMGSWLLLVGAAVGFTLGLAAFSNWRKKC